MTYENILSSMLEGVTSDVDKREGSIIYDALAPCALKLAETYFELNNFLNLVFSDTTVGIYLDRCVADFGLSRKQATKAIRKIITSGVVPIGTRWAIEDTTYKVIEFITVGEYKAECEQYGDIGNTYTGTLQSLDNISGITANLTAILLSGQEEENDENLRDRFYNKVRMPATSGNTYHYRQWALEVEGIGDCKVFPIWNGAGTVKVLIVDSNKEVDETLEATVATHIEEVRPIGATVTVDSPTAKTIEATSTITLDGSKTLEEVKASFEEKLKKYLNSTVFKTYSISYAMIGSILLTTPGVSDYENLLVNSGTANIAIESTEIPILGAVTLTEVVD
ncbi:baseplate J protein [Sporanaerobium hydrogeniformans]|uniref:Baseplate J protein n=2 Tax=Sporanaerobium hydrogeniformans TaxID=3072179 RepID=A0AC61DI73_9FIRM|nr:baseplate J protein [Sporanaerobium hydrogeniformans]